MTPYLGQLQLVAFVFAPKGWALCNGQLLPINQNQALFALLGTTYGGNGTTTFALPDLRGRVAASTGNGLTLGSVTGTESVALTAQTMPAHTHTLNAGPAQGTLGTPTGHSFAGLALGNSFGSSSNGVMDPTSINATGGGQAHENRMPYTVLSWIIALQGIFPTQN